MPISADDVFNATMSPDEMKASDQRARELLDEYDTLQKLRKARALTQETIAKKMGTKQVSVAQLEKRSDLLLSTLRSYVQALGGELDLVIRFEGHDPVVLAGFGEDSEPPSSEKRPRRRPSSAAAA
ncbi:helix-turn-helix domain-containing protein [Agrobacterium rubi]|uniref:Helix-turn-helix transcriptional regulator n=1 Tax=Agrobacterium rubi TaxID=28099 RepID=A0AAE7R066_9HYPH|nr:helix-turn-helix domain-containing protein [Agrobacterium rubi]NTE89290.1 helix-turn-helix transcriptional regulator [Agrobacterium rubi]NTF05072.1 helix-turn-helix transcriptional regulator [Agrobacterium rubi]NTF38842.1 helix-turn-helix transcriptional regulator [Agrobacterium rubi]OCJ43121.1 transcriptional regulator [Agrobacterium rubi]QTF99837.1 helix-turn-helix transcriptional regulator [Agrobacterium rubi]